MSSPKLDRDEYRVVEADVAQLQAQIEHVLQTIEQSLPTLERVMPKIQNRQARRAVDKLYAIVGQKPPHQRERDKRARHYISVQSG